MMKIKNIRDRSHGFEVLQTTPRSQTAVMTLTPGGQSSEEMNTHVHSDQVLLVVEGEVEGEIAGEKITLRAGDVCIVPAGTPHRFENRSASPALTFNVYSPPEYSPGEKD
jgi:mannose-6-phosphate isomerase-like protein (cupin superfamily)